MPAVAASVMMGVTLYVVDRHAGLSNVVVSRMPSVVPVHVRRTNSPGHAVAVCPDPNKTSMIGLDGGKGGA